MLKNQVICRRTWSSWESGQRSGRWNTAYKVHFGRRNKGVGYVVNEERIQKSEMQRDLGVLMQDFRKVHLQIESVIRKVNRGKEVWERFSVSEKCGRILKVYGGFVEPAEVS